MGIQSFVDTWLGKARAGIAILIASVYAIMVLSAIFVFKDPDLMVRLIETDVLLGMVTVLVLGGSNG